MNRGTVLGAQWDAAPCPGAACNLDSNVIMAKC